MFYLVANDTIIQTAENTFPIHGDLQWLEADKTPTGYKSVYADGIISFEKLPELAPHVHMTYKVARDVIFCLGDCPAGNIVLNPNDRSGNYNQYIMGVEGSSGYVLVNGTQVVKIEERGKLYDLSTFKGNRLQYGAYDNHAKWVAINPLNDIEINVTVLAGQVNNIITDNPGGITLFNAKGYVFVNDTVLELNDSVFYHANTNIDLRVKSDSYAIVIRYQQLPETA
jgi:hypothetical protein